MSHGHRDLPSGFAMSEDLAMLREVNRVGQLRRAG